MCDSKMPYDELVNVILKSQYLKVTFQIIEFKN